MKTATLISAVATVLFMLTTMICGLWLKANQITAEDSVNFHVTCGIASVVLAFITMLLLIIFLARTKKKGR